MVKWTHHATQNVPPRSWVTVSMTCFASCAKCRPLDKHISYSPLSALICERARDMSWVNKHYQPGATQVLIRENKLHVFSIALQPISMNIIVSPLQFNKFHIFRHNCYSIIEPIRTYTRYSGLRITRG